MSRARPASVEEYGRLHNLVEGLCIAGGLPKPRLYIVDDPSPNAFATGRDPKHAAIAVTTGLLEKLNRVELEGVLAHELSHIKNYDILVSTLAVTMVGVIAIAADVGIRFMWFGMGRNRNNSDDGGGGGGLTIIFAFIGFALLILSPLIGRAMQAAVSRRRETLADVSGVELTRYPPGLISALEKLRDDYTVVGSTSHATAHLWIEQPQAVEEEEGPHQPHQPHVRHPPPARGAHRAAPRALNEETTRVARADPGHPEEAHRRRRRRRLAVLAGSRRRVRAGR